MKNVGPICVQTETGSTLITRLMARQQAVINQQLEYRKSSSIQDDDTFGSILTTKKQISSLVKSLRTKGWNKAVVKDEAEPCLSAKTYSEHARHIVKQSRLYSNHNTQLPRMNSPSRTWRDDLRFDSIAPRSANNRESVKLGEYARTTPRIHRLCFVRGVRGDGITLAGQLNKLDLGVLHSSPYLACGVYSQDKPMDLGIVSMPGSSPVFLSVVEQPIATKTIAVHGHTANHQRNEHGILEDRPTPILPSVQSGPIPLLAAGACELLRRGTAAATQNGRSRVSLTSADIPAGCNGSKELVVSLLSVRHCGSCRGRCIDAFCTLTASSAKQVQFKTKTVKSNCSPKFNEDFRFQFLDPHEPGDVQIQLLDSSCGGGGSLLGQSLLRSNEIHSLMRQDIGWSSSECTYHLKSRKAHTTAEDECIAEDYVMAISFSVVPNRITRRKRIFDDSVLHASWGGIRAMDMESIGSRLLCMKQRNCSSSKTKWSNHLLFRSGHSILGLPEKGPDGALSNTVFVMTIYAVQNLPRFDVSDGSRIYCLISCPSAKQAIQRSRTVRISYDAADLGEEFDFEFSELDKPGDITVELFRVPSGCSKPCLLGLFLIPGVEVLAAASQRSFSGQKAKELSLLDPCMDELSLDDQEYAEKTKPIMLYNLKIVQDIRQSDSSFVFLFHLSNVQSLEEEYISDLGLILNLNFLRRYGIAKEDYHFSEMLSCAKGDELEIIRPQDSRFFIGEFNGWQVSIPATLTDVQQHECTVGISISSKSEYFDTLSFFQKLCPTASLHIDPKNALLCPSATVGKAALGKSFWDSSLLHSQKFSECCSQFLYLDQSVSQLLQDLETSTSLRTKVGIEWDVEKKDTCSFHGCHSKSLKSDFAKSQLFSSSCRTWAVETKNKHTASKQQPMMSQYQTGRDVLSSSFPGKLFPALAGSEVALCFWCTSRKALQLGFEHLNHGDLFEAKRQAVITLNLLQQNIHENSEIQMGYLFLESKINEIKLMVLNSRMFAFAQAGNLENLRKCLEHGADVTACYGETEWIEGKGLFTTQPFLRGFTVVHFAVMPCMGSEKQSKFECLKYVSALDGCPSLSLSADGSIECMIYLLGEAGVDPEALDDFGKRASDYTPRLALLSKSSRRLKRVTGFFRNALISRCFLRLQMNRDVQRKVEPAV